MYKNISKVDDFIDMIIVYNISLLSIEYASQYTYSFFFDLLYNVSAFEFSDVLYDINLDYFSEYLGVFTIYEYKLTF
jgi:hypothetical protein